MSTFFISRASAVAFVINRGADAINEDVQPIDFEWLDGVRTTGDDTTVQFISEFFNCGIKPTDYNQSWKWGDTIRFQFIYEHTSGFPPAVEILDVDRNHVLYVVPSAVDSAVENLWDVTFDTSRLDEPADCACYTVLIGTLVLGDDNLFPCGTAGTFEGALGTWGASTGGNNTLGQSVLGVAHSGNFSAIVTADATPSLPASRTLIQCDSPQAYSTEQYYYYSGWAYIPSSGSLVDASDSVRWDILSTVSDAEVVYETFAEGNVVDQWQQFTILFKTNSDLSGTPRVIVNIAPIGGGDVWIDDLEYKETNAFPEAVSQRINVCQNVKCGLQIFYNPRFSETSGSESDTTEMNITSYGSGSYQNFNVEGSFRRFRLDDPEGETTINSAGTSSQIVSRPDKIYTFKTSPVPAYMLEKIALALKFSNVLIRPSGGAVSIPYSVNAVRMVLFGKAPTVEWEEGTQLIGGRKATLEWEMVPETYNYERSNC